MSANHHVSMGLAEAWACRWLEHGPKNKYTVTFLIYNFCIISFDAVIDDFGNLVKVDK